MGEKPMGWAEDAADEAAGLELGGVEVATAGRAQEAEKAAGPVRPAEPREDDPGAGAAGINTTRDNIRHGASSSPPGGPPASTGEPIPGLDF